VNERYAFLGRILLKHHVPQKRFSHVKYLIEMGVR
jgi:hypothetical protein